MQENIQEISHNQTQRLQTKESEKAQTTEQLITNPDNKDGPVKRIIKIPLPDILRKKMRTNPTDKEWQPITIQQFKKDKAATTDKKVSSIAKDFMLPKPKNSDQFKPKPAFSYPKMLPKPLMDVQKPTQDQIKFDIEDQSFIVKEFEKANPNPNLKERFEEDLPEIRQQDLPEEFKGKRITNVSKQSLVDADWERKQKQRKMRLTLWQGANEVVNSVTGKGKQKNQINALLEDAMKRAEEVDFELGKKSTQRKAMKNRYGW